MKTKLLAGIALSALASAVAMTGNAVAADLGGNGGSVKDGGYMAPMPELVRGAAGPCYFRADVGYSWARDPEVKWPVNSDRITGFFEDNNTDNKFHETARDSTFITDDVSNTSRESGAFGEFGMGCGFGGSRGIRAEMMFGVRGNRKVDGEPGVYTLEYDVIDDPDPVVPFVPFPHPADPTGNGEEIDDPLHTSIRSYTYMFNFYKDLGKFGNITPYVGAGAGVAYHMVDETYFTGNPFLTNKIEGNNDISFAWSLMAGMGYQVSDRAILDFGYRYMDMGSAESGRVDSAGFVNPRVEFDDLTAHEIKVGLRYHFGDDCCAAQSYAPMK